MILFWKKHLTADLNSASSVKDLNLKTRELFVLFIYFCLSFLYEIAIFLLFRGIEDVYIPWFKVVVLLFMNNMNSNTYIFKDFIFLQGGNFFNGKTWNQLR